MLFIQIEPRHSIYDSSETTAELIVDASLSFTHGTPYKNATANPGYKGKQPFNTIYFDVRIEETDQLLVSNNVTVNSTDNMFEFDLESLKPRLKPYELVFYGAPLHEIGNQSYTATTKFYYLPAKNTGSTVKIDNLDGGLLVANNVTKYAFEPLLPFGFYTSCSGYLNYSLANVSAYKDLGFNAINPVCAFTDGDITYLFDWLDEVNLWYQYDMRGSYLNLTSVAEQIPLVKERSSFLMWYTADEPDGWQYALNSTKLAYHLLKQQDPYHPTALVLNCKDYYFKDYSAGADIVMEDAYPVGINATWSRPYDVPCNDTYGDCGCDDCIGELQDVSDRLDDFYDYQEWLGEWEKPLWAVLQAFSGEGYWNRDPTTKETWSMILLSFNHRAKAIMSWQFPASHSLNKAHGAFAKVATVPPVSSFLLDAEPQEVKVKGDPLLDVSYWKYENQVMVGIVNLDYADTHKKISITLPVHASHIKGQPWGSLSWTLSSVGNSSTEMSVYGMDGLTTSIVILEL